jgi:UDP-N-acetylglucosamine diphosphorylase/glucosamine-1-phosphate N-acetyltransferase
MKVIVFEDRQVERLYPITLGRPAYAVSCGGYRLIDWLAALELPLRGIVRPHLMELQRLDDSAAQVDRRMETASTAAARRRRRGDRQPAAVVEPAQGGGEPVLLVNARVVPSVAAYEALARLVLEGKSGAVRAGDQLAAAVLPPTAPPPVEGLATDQVDDFFRYAGIAALPALDVELDLFTWPHDVIAWHMRLFRESLERRLAEGEYREVADGVFAAEGATLGQYVVCDTRGGPIVLESGATVGPYCLLGGPAYLGRNARLIEHAAIKDGVALGHTTKIGGEVEASIIEPYTNKQHHGFLGHSYLGSWINLGAGTCNSDLKNTYGEVKMEYRGEKVATGMQFVGCVIGDYAKTAINTGIFTGKVVGACSMVYGFVTTNVPSFVNYARLFGQVTELPPEVMAATQRRMFARRQVEQRPADVRLIHDMYELTRDERQLAGEPLSL